MDDVLIIGGGVIGLSLAYELSRQGGRVRVVDRAAPGQESSWAGAGILPPAVVRPGDPPLEQLTGLSHALHPAWAQRLGEQTGIDTGFSRCGGLYLAHDRPLSVDGFLRNPLPVSERPANTDPQADHELRQFANWNSERGVEARLVSPAELREIEPVLAGERLSSACLLPGECQLRNPRHVKALLVACAAQGVEVHSGLPVDDFIVRGGRIEVAVAGGEPLRAGQFCIAGGAWTRAILARLGCQISIKPIRGQIVLLAGGRRVLRHIVNDGHRYLVPRSDGRVLVGSTEEDAGFDKRTTAEAIGELLHFALTLVPALRDHQVERTWAGLRPGNGDGLPYLGRLPGLENAFVAAGHYRQGLHLSTGTAVVMSQLLRGEPPQIDLHAFSVERRLK